jgi:hypothetical protein
MNPELLVRGLNNCVDEGRSLVPKDILVTYGGSEWPKIREFSAAWEAGGFLEVISDPESTCMGKPCVRMKNFIGAATPLPKWWLTEKMPDHWESKK